MTEADYFREKAQRCRELLRVATAPEVIEQLRLWAREFDAEAAAVDGERRREQLTY